MPIIMIKFTLCLGNILYKFKWIKLRLEGDKVIVVETEFIARYSETDQMGIIHHSNYPVWFEAGRTDFFKRLGMHQTG